MKRIQFSCKHSVNQISNSNSQGSQYDALWLNVSPTLRFLDQPLLNYLAQYTRIGQWEYCQGWDEASSLNSAIVLLHDYLKSRHRPIHLVGHGMGGVLALTYARRYPQRVASLSLLSVAAQPALTWHTHYYVQRHLIPCLSKAQLLARLSYSLLGSSSHSFLKALIKALDQDLTLCPHPHSLFRLSHLPKAEVAMPLLVCGCQTDPIVHASLYEWHTYFKPEDQLWQCADGRHFFHFSNPELVGSQLVRFWQQAKMPLSLEASRVMKKG